MCEVWAELARNSQETYHPFFFEPKWTFVSWSKKFPRGDLAVTQRC